MSNTGAITSPRPSLSLRSPSATSSTRTSLDLHPTQTSSPLSAAPLRPPRRNRTALRDYYNLKTTAPPPDVDPEQVSTPVENGPLSELDAPGFEAGTFVRNLLQGEALGGVLRVEGLLMGEIKGLDGERKALVYDNYSRLILAAGTIQKMRSNIDPMSPATSTLAPAIAHIVETASSLEKLRAQEATTDTAPRQTSHNQEDKDRIAAKHTIQWVLGTPTRLQAALSTGDRDAASRDWMEVSALLDKWSEVPGVADLRERCEDVMGEDSAD